MGRKEFDEEQEEKEFNKYKVRKKEEILNKVSEWLGRNDSWDKHSKLIIKHFDFGGLGVVSTSKDILIIEKL